VQGRHFGWRHRTLAAPGTKSLDGVVEVVNPIQAVLSKQSTDLATLSRNGSLIQLRSQETPTTGNGTKTQGVLEVEGGAGGGLETIGLASDGRTWSRRRRSQTFLRLVSYLKVIFPTACTHCGRTQHKRRG
jgi:hypothetical protein